MRCLGCAPRRAPSAPERGLVVLDPDRPTPSSSAIEAKETPPRRVLLLLLIAATAVGPLSLNILMPAVPGLVATFGADVGIVQLTLSLYLVGMAVSQLVLGPLSDRFGRRPVMIAGLCLTVVASFVALIASSITGLIVARMIQAFGATTGIVIGRAIVRDLYDRDRAASMIGWVTMAMVVAPMIAPIIGGALDTTLGWHAIFVFVGSVAALVLVWTALALPETRNFATSESLTRFFGEARMLLTSRAFAGYALVSAFNSAQFFTFLGGAPHVVVTQMGLSSAVYGIWFAISSFAYMGGNFTAGRWSARYGVDAMLRAGILITAIGAIVGVAWLLLEPNGGPHIIFIPQMITAFASGFMLPNAIAGAVSVRPHAAGTASGVAGFLQMGLGAAMSQLVGHLLAGASTAMPMAIVVGVLCIGSWCAFFGLVRRKETI